MAVDVRKDINRWLGPPNVNIDLRRHLSNYMEGCCKWLVGDPSFQDSLSGNEPSILSIVARPGGGKSTAAAFLTQHLTQTVSAAILYFFCRNSDAEKRTTICILRSLLWQLLQHDGNLYTTAAQWFYQVDQTIADSQSHIISIFAACLQANSVPSVSIVVDALDECLDASDLLLALSSAMMVSNRVVKLYVFSRDAVTVPHIPQLRSQTIYMTGDKSHITLDFYVKQRLTQISSMGPHWQDSQSSEPILDASGGVWLNARLLLDDLDRATNLGEVQRQISGFPRGLKNVYSELLRIKEKAFSEVQLKMAQELYLWLDKTEYMPEWQRWKGDDDLLDDETICTILTIATASKQLFDAVKAVTQLLTPLIELRITSPHFAIDAHGVPYNSPPFAVDFFHQTAKQYLRWSLDAPVADLPLSLRPRRLASLYRGATAVRYLGHSHEFQDCLQRLREHPKNGNIPTYLEMVHGLWDALKLTHLRWDLDGEEVAKAGTLCDQLSSFLTTDKCLGWIEAAIIINYAGRWNQLIESAEEVLEIPPDPRSSTAAFHRFHDARRALMADFIYVLSSTWPKKDHLHSPPGKTPKMPHGFQQRPLARKLIAIARNYHWLLTPGYIRPTNGYSIDPQL